MLDVKQPVLEQDTPNAFKVKINLAQEVASLDYSDFFKKNKIMEYKSLREIDASEYDLGDDGLQALTRGLMQKDAPEVRKLNLKFTFLWETKSFTNLINTNKIASLNICSNFISPNQRKHIIKKLIENKNILEYKGPSTPLLRKRLKQNKIRAKRLATSLKNGDDIFYKNKREALIARRAAILYILEGQGYSQQDAINLFNHHAYPTNSQQRKKTKRNIVKGRSIQLNPQTIKEAKQAGIAG